jgi:hypothetical protein
MSRGEQDTFGPEATSTGQRSLVREYPVADGILIDVSADRQHPARAFHSQRRRGAQPHVPAGAVQQLIPQFDPGRLDPQQDLTAAGRRWVCSSRMTSPSAPDTPHSFIVNPFVRSGRSGSAGRNP